MAPKGSRQKEAGDRAKAAEAKPAGGLAPEHPASPGRGAVTRPPLVTSDAASVAPAATIDLQITVVQGDMGQRGRRSCRRSTEGKKVAPFIQQGGTMAG